MSDLVDTGELLEKIRACLAVPLAMTSIGEINLLLSRAAVAIEQLHELVESERRKSANCEERVNTLLQSEIDDGR